MNTPRNYITALPAYSFVTDAIDHHLPFTNKRVFVRDISKTPKGYGRWKLSVELKINDKAVVLHAVTNDSKLIDEWYTDDREVNEATMVSVVEIVLAANEGKLEELD